MDKPNLFAVNCTHIVWSCRLQAAELSLRAFLEEIDKSERQGGSAMRALEYDVAAAGKLRAFGWLQFREEAGKYDNLGFTLDISSTPQWPPELSLPNAPTLEQLVDAVIEEKQVTELHVAATFSYPLGSFRSALSLPLPTSYPDDEPAEIIGVLVRVKNAEADSQTRYTNAITLADNEQVIHHVSYRAVPPIERDCIPKTLKLASAFSRRMVVRKEVGTSNKTDV